MKNKQKGTTTLEMIFIVGFLLLITIGLCFKPFACTRNEHAKEILEIDGYTNIEFTGYSWFACGERDSFHTGFKALKNGKIVEGTVCEGLIFKNATIRYK